MVRPTFFQNELNLKEYNKNMCINYIFAFLLIKITTTTSNEVNLSNKWPLLTEAGLEDGKDDIYIFNEIHQKNDENAYFSDIF